MNLDEQASRLRALWKSGRDKYASFFSVLEEVRAEIGNNSLQDWCYHELRISLSIIAETRKVLTKTEADITKRNLAVAVAAEKNKAREIREADRKARENESHARALEKQQRLQELADAKLATEQKNAAVEAVKGKTKQEKKETKRRKRTASDLISEISSAELYDLIKRFDDAETLCKHGRSEWVEGSIAKAIVLATIRSKIISDIEFGEWCDANTKLNKNDRAALVGLGHLGESRLREIFTETESHSYRYIWNEYKPELRVV